MIAEPTQKYHRKTTGGENETHHIQTMLHMRSKDPGYQKLVRRLRERIPMR